MELIFMNYILLLTEGKQKVFQCISKDLLSGSTKHIIQALSYMSVMIQFNSVIRLWWCVVVMMVDCAGLYRFTVILWAFHT